MELKSADISSGSIQYYKHVAATPETKETVVDNVNVIQAGTPESPSHFEVAFLIDASFKKATVAVRSVFNFNVVILEENDRAPYRLVEDQAARLIAPMLRSVADRIEADLPDFSDDVDKHG